MLEPREDVLLGGPLLESRDHLQQSIVVRGMSWVTLTKLLILNGCSLPK